MSMKMFDSIDSLHEGKYDWNLRVRVVREWDSYSSKAGKEFKGKNLLLLDDKQSRIHAFIWPNNIQDIKCEIVEGGLYTIRNVMVKTYREDSIKCIQSDKQLWFSSKTKMQPLENYDHMIQNNVFDFYNFADIKSLPATFPKTQLIDVIGFLVEEDYNIRKITNSNDVQQTQLRFTLTDGRHTAKFCFWDTFAVSFDTKLKEEEEKPVIVIVSSCRYNQFKEEIHLSNLNATRFFLNYNHHAVEHLRERYNDGILRLPAVDEPVAETPQIYSLANIQKLQSDFIDRDVICQIKIINIEEDSNWWHYTCSKCHNAVKKIDDDFHCESTCNRIVPVPEKSFKILVNVEDETGGAAILLFDREVQRLIGKNVYEVSMLHRKSGKKDVLPEILKTVEGKQCTCTIKLTESNVKQRSCMYNVVDIFEGFEIIENSDNQPDEDSAKFQNSQVGGTISEDQSISLTSFTTPDTEKSTTLKTTKRKIENIVMDPMSSLQNDDGSDETKVKNVENALLKNIKKERD